MFGTVNAKSAPCSGGTVNCQERHVSLTMPIRQFGIDRIKLICNAQRNVPLASTMESMVSTTNGVSFSSRQNSSGVDIVLSSGFLAFASHCGFLQAVQDVGLNVKGVMGTSSGALTGSLFAAGYSPMEIAQEFSRLPPIERIKLSKEPWKGVFSLDPATKRLRELLPDTFDEMEIDFGVGVVSRYGYDIVDSGSLAEAVVASAAVPVLFNPVRIPSRNNTPHIDGGIKTRVGLEAWRAHQKRKLGILQPRPAAVHVVSRSSPFSGSDKVDTESSDDVALVLSPKSTSSLWDMSHFTHQMEHTYAAAVPVLQVFADHIHPESTS